MEDGKQKGELTPLRSEEDEAWIYSVNVTLGVVGAESSIASIYSVPKQLRNSNSDAFSPRLVSIGPIHRLKDDLLPMQAHKWSYMLCLLEQTSYPRKCLDKCSEAMLRIDVVVRASYAGRVDNLKPHELAQIMLVDGCFLLQLFLRSDSSSSSDSDPKPANQDGDNWDPLFNNNAAPSSGSIISLVRHDLILFENQIPLFVLEHLFKIIEPYLNKEKNPEKNPSSSSPREQPSDKATTSSEKGPEFQSDDDQNNNKKKNKKPSKVVELAHSFFSSPYFFSSPDEIYEKFPPCKNYHKFSPFKNFLDIVHKSYYIPMKGEPVKYTELRYCATEIEEAGIKIMVKNEEGKKLNLLQISFYKERRVLEIPPLKIEQTTTTESFFRNLIALEQCNEIGKSYYFTSYAFFLRDLICSSSDIELLKKKKILIDNTKKNQNEISLLNLFQGLTKGVDYLEESCFGALCKDLNESISPCCCFWRWHRCLESFIVGFWKNYYILSREYCSNLWRITQIIAAILILLFTGLQTFYTVFK